MRATLLRLAVTSFALTTLLWGGACVELKERSASPDGQSPVVDGATADGGVLPGAPALASARRRLTSQPKSWFVSEKYIYVANDGLIRLRASTGETLDYGFPIDRGNPRPKLDATDTHVVVQMHDRLTIYDGSTGAKADYTDLNKPYGSIALSKQVAWVRVATDPSALSLYVILPAANAQPQETNSIAALDATVIGGHGADVFLHAPDSLDLWVADTDARTTTKWALPSGAVVGFAGVAGSPDEVVIAFGDPEQPTFTQLGKDGPTRDLSADIMAASSSIAPAMRRPIDGRFAQRGKWFLYAALGGLLAFDRVDGRLVPCQLPLSSGVRLRSPRVVEDNLLIFELLGGDERAEGAPGLYAVELSMLP